MPKLLHYFVILKTDHRIIMVLFSLIMSKKVRFPLVFAKSYSPIPYFIVLYNLYK